MPDPRAQYARPTLVENCTCYDRIPEEGLSIREHSAFSTTEVGVKRI